MANCVNMHHLKGRKAKWGWTSKMEMEQKTDQLRSDFQSRLHEVRILFTRAFIWCTIEVLWIILDRVILARVSRTYHAIFFATAN